MKIGLFFVLLCIGASGAMAPDRIAFASDPATLSAKAMKNGHVRIIVGLKLPPPGFRPEGVLSESEIEAQRDAIAAVREALLDSMSGFDIEVYRHFTSLPSVAMRVDDLALEKLITSPYVKSIEEDVPEQVHEKDASE